MRSSDSGLRRKVAHVIGVWLGRTETWLYSEVTKVGELWEPWVATNRTMNIIEFPYDKIFSVRDDCGYYRWLFETLLVRTSLYRQYPSIIKFIKDLNPSIIHSHFGHVGWKNLGIIKLTGAKHVVSFYGYDVTRLPRSEAWRKKYLQLFEESDLFLCEGPHMASQLEQLGCPKDKINLCHLGVNVDKIIYKKPMWQPGKPLRILMAASFREKKGLPYGFLSLAEVMKKMPALKLHITVVGDADKSSASQIEKKKIYDVVTTNGLSNIVNFVGSCSHDDLFHIAAENDVFISPSVTAASGDTEGGAPVTLTEMMAVGLPIVSTIHCDIPHVLSNENRVLLAPERDVSALANAIIWLLNNHEKWEIITSANRQRVTYEFNISNQGRILSNIYEQLL